MPNVLGALSEQRDFRLYALQLFLLFYECSPDLDKLVDGLKGRKVQGRNQKFHLFELGTTIKCLLPLSVWTPRPGRRPTAPPPSASLRNYD